MRRRQAYDDNINYDDNLLADEAGDEDTQNDTDNGYGNLEHSRPLPFLRNS